MSLGENLEVRFAPAREPVLGAWLGPHAKSWPPGPTVVARSIVGSGEPRPLAAVRVGAPPPGEGYHQEHLRELRVRGEGAALEAALRFARREADPRLRLEALAPAGGASSRALRAAGFELEASVPGGWRAERFVDLEWWGRPARGRRRVEAPLPVATGAETGGAGLPTGIRVVVHGEATRRSLAAFLDALVPGRAYPPGTLLSEAERRETRRPGDLDAEWLLAIDEKDRVVGGLVLEPQRPRSRSHVRRVHVDVAPEARGHGVGTALCAGARFRASKLGVAILEADPRAGHVVVLRALERAGFRRAGSLAGSWRMRDASGSRDEDVVLLWTETTP